MVISHTGAVQLFVYLNLRSVTLTSDEYISQKLHARRKGVNCNISDKRYYHNDIVMQQLFLTTIRFCSSV